MKKEVIDFTLPVCTSVHIDGIDIVHSNFSHICWSHFKFGTNVTYDWKMCHVFQISWNSEIYICDNFFIAIDRSFVKMMTFLFQ